MVPGNGIPLGGMAWILRTYEHAPPLVGSRDRFHRMQPRPGGGVKGHFNEKCDPESLGKNKQLADIIFFVIK